MSIYNRNSQFIRDQAVLRLFHFVSTKQQSLQPNVEETIINDIAITANRIFILLFYEMKSMLNKPCFLYFLLEKQVLTKIVWTLITLINKGILQLVRLLICHNCHFTFGVTLLVLYFQCDAKVVIILQTSKLF